jgi:hypothetical protein
MPGIFLTGDKSSWRGAMRVGVTMIDALLNVAVFAVVVLCIIGFGVNRARTRL